MGLAKGDKREMNEKRKPLLAVKNFSVSFQEERGFKKRRIQPIRDLSLEICAGEITALAGPAAREKPACPGGDGDSAGTGRSGGNHRISGTGADEGVSESAPGQRDRLIPQGVNGLDPLMRAGNQIRKGRRIWLPLSGWRNC